MAMIVCAVIGGVVIACALWAVAAEAISRRRWWRETEQFRRGGS